MGAADLPERSGAIIHTGPIAAWKWDPAAKILTWSDGMFELFGIDPSEWNRHGHPVRELVLPEDRALVEEALESVRMGRRPRPLECRILRSDGSMRWVRLEGDTFTDEVGKLIVIGIVRDITERKQAEEALRESEERYRTLCEESTDGVCVFADGEVAFANTTLLQMLGYSEEEFKSAQPMDMIHPADRQRASQRIREIIEGGPESTTRYRCLRKDGSVVVVEGKGRAVRFGGRRAVMTAVRDVTEPEPPYGSSDVLEALRAARTALEEVALLLPRDSAGDLAAAKALGKIYKILSRE
jgi:PAS domain S-box-containing protein